MKSATGSIDVELCLMATYAFRPTRADAGDTIRYPGQPRKEVEDQTKTKVMLSSEM